MAFERIAETIYSMLPKKKSEMNQVEQMGVVFTSGYIAGILCGAVSHPADTLVSKINKLKMDGSFGQKASHIYGEIGFSGLWKGFTPRVIMVFIFFFFCTKTNFFHFSLLFFFFPSTDRYPHWFAMVHLWCIQNFCRSSSSWCFPRRFEKKINKREEKEKINLN